MYQLYEDISRRLGDPKWYDEHGVPRYDDFHPMMLDVYADYAALSLIRCQSCGRNFQVGVSWSIIKAINRGREEKMPDGSFIQCGVKWDPNGENGRPVSMPSPAKLGEFGYGDAPWHVIDGSQCAGTTMTVDEVACLQFWHRSLNQQDENFMEWVRVPEYEVVISDSGYSETLDGGFQVHDPKS